MPCPSFSARDLLGWALSTHEYILHVCSSVRIEKLTYSLQLGTVAAAHEWDDDMEVMSESPSRPDSYEWLAHETGIDLFLLDLREDEADKDIREALMKKRLERFIGVIYRPATERWSH